MPKTKDAFAFRNFDQNNILQRPYFKGKWRADSDDLLLCAMGEHMCRNADEMEEESANIKRLAQKVLDYANLIDRHMLRCNKYFGTKKPLIEYLSARLAVLDLYTELRQMFISIEDAIKVRRREDFVQQLSHYRIKAGLSQGELGRKVNLSATTMSKYALGKAEPPLYVMIRLAKALNVSLDDLLKAK